MKGDLLKLAQEGLFDCVVHGCNCDANMGGGIAAQIAELYPEAKAADEEYHMYHEAYPAVQMGDLSFACTDHGFVIVNGYTQRHGGSGTFSYAALELVLMKVNAMFPGSRIGLPYIGCGIAGGDQNKIVDIIEQFAIDAAKDGTQVTLVEYA